MADNIKVKKSDPPETREILAEAIVRLGEAVKKLNDNGLNQRAIILLLHDATHVGKTDIKEILGAIPRLKAWHCR